MRSSRPPTSPSTLWIGTWRWGSGNRFPSGNYCSALQAAGATGHNRVVLGRPRFPRAVPTRTISLSVNRQSHPVRLQARRSPAAFAAVRFPRQVELLPRLARRHRIQICKSSPRDRASSRSDAPSASTRESTATVRSFICPTAAAPPLPDAFFVAVRNAENPPRLPFKAAAATSGLTQRQGRWSVPAIRADWCVELP